MDKISKFMVTDIYDKDLLMTHPTLKRKSNLRYTDFQLTKLQKNGST